MLEHDFVEPASCWCGPDVDTGIDADGEAWQTTMHHDEEGHNFAYTLDDDIIPICPDCDCVMEGLIPDPPSLIRDGHVYWIWSKLTHPGIGVSTNQFDDAYVVNLSFWNRTLHVNLRSAGKRKTVSERTADMAPQMLDEIEQHLRSHG